MEQATTSARVVSVSKDQSGVALIHLNRPPANSYDRQFMDDLNAAIDEIRFDEAIGAAVLISDLPKFFSAGADIGMFRSGTAKAAAVGGYGGGREAGVRTHGRYRRDQAGREAGP